MDNQPLASLSLEDESAAAHRSIRIPLESRHRRVSEYLDVYVLWRLRASFCGEVLELPFKSRRNLVPSIHSSRSLAIGFAVGTKFGIQTRSKEGGVFAKRQLKRPPIGSCHRVEKPINRLSYFRRRRGWRGL